MTHNETTVSPFEVLWPRKNLRVAFTSITRLFCKVVILPLLFLPVIASLFISVQQSLMATPTIKHMMADYNLFLLSIHNIGFILFAVFPIESSSVFQSSAEINEHSKKAETHLRHPQSFKQYV